MMRHVILALAAFAGIFLTGCSKYLDDYYYAPRPALAAVPATQPNEPPTAMVLASVIGVRRADDAKKIPEAVEIRLRVEADRDPVTIDPTSLSLITGTLLPFPPPSLVPAAPVTVGPGQQAEIEAVFPLPANLTHETLDLSSLRLRGRLTAGNRPVNLDVAFQRAVPVYVGPYYYDPWYGPYYGGYFFGGTYHRHWR